MAVPTLINRRDAIRCVGALLGGVAFTGGGGLLAAAARQRPAAGTAVGDFSAADIAFLDEIAETILPATAGVPFMQATPEQRLQVLTVLDGEQKRVMDVLESSRSELLAHHFRMMKELALLGYFTSEIGCTQALRYVETPGRFDPCVPYTAGDPAWAAHG